MSFIIIGITGSQTASDIFGLSKKMIF